MNFSGDNANPCQMIVLLLLHIYHNDGILSYADFTCDKILQKSKLIVR